MSFLTQQEADKIIEERTHEEVYKEFKATLFNNEAVYHNCLIKISDEETIIKEITLEDILIALSENEYRVAVRADGIFFREEYNINDNIYLLTNELDIKWTLGLPASRQSNETLIALTNSLKKEIKYVSSFETNND